MFKDEFLLAFQEYLRKTLRLLLAASIFSFLAFSFLEWLKKGVVSNVFNHNLFFASGVLCLVLIVLDFVSQNSDRQKIEPLNNRERIWLFLIAISFSIFVWQKLQTYGFGALPFSAAIFIFVFFLLRALLEAPTIKETSKENSYQQFFQRLYLVSSVVTLSFPAILLAVVFSRDISPFLSYHFAFDKPHPLFVEYNPKDARGQTLPYAKTADEITLEFKQDQTHFTITLPDLCERVKIKVTFTQEEMEEVNLKLPNFDQVEPLERFPLYNFLLASLSWPYINNDTWRLYQKSKTNHVYQTIDEFFESPPENKKIASFSHQKLPFATLPLKDETQIAKLDYIITNYKPPEQRGLLLINEYEGQIPQKLLAQGIGAEYKFYLEAYGQKEGSKVSIKSLNLTFLRPPVNFGSLANFFLHRLGIR